MTMASDTTMTISQWLSEAKKHMAGVDDTIVVEWLLCEHLQVDRAYLRCHPQQFIAAADLHHLQLALDKLLQGVPLSYVLGYQDFWDMRLAVNESTLIPRSDTETLIRAVLSIYPADSEISMIDLGTGSGAIAIALSREYQNAVIFASDISSEVIDIAKKNAGQWQESVIQFKQADWLTGFQADSLDCIVSNPPYIAADDLHLHKLTHEPTSALVAKDNGLADIATIILQAENALKKDGWLFIEHGYNQADAVADMLKDWQQVVLFHDLANRPRVTAARR